MENVTKSKSKCDRVKSFYIDEYCQILSALALIIVLNYASENLFLHFVLES